MPAARLWRPLTWHARIRLNPLPCALKAALWTCEAAHCCHRRRHQPLAALSSAMPTQVEAAAPRLVWASIASFRWHEGLLRAFCLVPWKAALRACEAPHGASLVPVHQLWVWASDSPRPHPQLVYDDPLGAQGRRGFTRWCNTADSGRFLRITALGHRRPPLKRWWGRAEPVVCAAGAWRL